jgi:hypothetical protein
LFLSVRPISSRVSISIFIKTPFWWGEG